MRFYKDPPTLEAMYEKAGSMKKFEIELAKYHVRFQEDFHYFNEIILGHHDMNKEHRDLCEFIQKDPKHFKLNLLPRHTFKSSVLTIGYSLWMMVRDPNIRILIYSDSASKACGFLQGIKNHIEGKAENSRFREFFPGWEGDGRKLKWTESEIIVSKRTASRVEPTVDVGGIDTSKVGKHYDLIFFDDIVSDTNVTTKNLMDKTFECYQKSLSLLKPGGEVVMVGTRWHFGDAYGRIIAEADDVWGVFIRDAEAINEQGKLLFEDSVLNHDFLMRQKKIQGSYIYSCLYRNNPVDDDSAVFKSKDFNFYERLKPSPEPLVEGLYPNLYITCTLDPSGEGKDPTAGVVVGTDCNMKMYILETYNQQATPDMMIDWVMEMNIKYRIKMFGIETTFFRGMLKKAFDRKIAELRLKRDNFCTFGIKEFSPVAKRGETKYARIMALQPIHERQEIYFPGKGLETLKTGYGQLAYQMMQLTPSHMPEPNDLLDALAYHVPIYRRGGFVEKEEVPVNSPAWLERGWIAEHNRLQKSLPRRYRRNWTPSFSGK